MSTGLGHGGGVGKEGGTRCSRFQASWGLGRPSKAVPSLGAKMLLPGAKVGDEDREGQACELGKISLRGRSGCRTDRQEGEGRWNGCGQSLTQCMAAQTSKRVVAQAPQASESAGSAERVCRGEGEKASAVYKSSTLPPK